MDEGTRAYRLQIKLVQKMHAQSLFRGRMTYSYTKPQRDAMEAALKLLGHVCALDGTCARCPTYEDMDILLELLREADVNIDL